MECHSVCYFSLFAAVLFTLYIIGICSYVKFGYLFGSYFISNSDRTWARPPLPAELQTNKSEIDFQVVDVDYYMSKRKFFKKLKF